MREELTIGELQDGMESGELTSVEVCRRYLNRIDHLPLELRTDLSFGELREGQQRGGVEVEQLTAERDRARAEGRNFLARREKTLLETEEKRRELADDDADSHYARTYTFYDDVTEESVGECIAALEHWSRRFPDQPITLQLCTGGGNIFDGMALFGFVRQLVVRGTEVTTVGLGWVASMGAVLLQCGSKRVLDRDAVLMIHNSVIHASGRMRAHEVHDESALLRKLDRQSAEILAEKSLTTPEEFLEMMERRDVWLSATEALELGLCDEVR